MIGCMRLRAISGILRTQRGRRGSGLGRLRAGTAFTGPALRGWSGPTSSYQVTLRRPSPLWPNSRCYTSRHRGSTLVGVGHCPLAIGRGCLVGLQAGVLDRRPVSPLPSSPACSGAGSGWHRRSQITDSTVYHGGPATGGAGPLLRADSWAATVWRIASAARLRQSRGHRAERGQPVLPGPSRHHCGCSLGPAGILPEPGPSRAGSYTATTRPAAGPRTARHAPGQWPALYSSGQWPAHLRQAGQVPGPLHVSTPTRTSGARMPRGPGTRPLAPRRSRFESTQVTPIPCSRGKCPSGSSRTAAPLPLFPASGVNRRYKPGQTFLASALLQAPLRFLIAPLHQAPPPSPSFQPEGDASASATAPAFPDICSWRFLGGSRLFARCFSPSGISACQVHGPSPRVTGVPVLWLGYLLTIVQQFGSHLAACNEVSILVPSPRVWVAGFWLLLRVLLLPFPRFSSSWIVLLPDIYSPTVRWTPSLRLFVRSEALAAAPRSGFGG
jgi:hypothetical protein